MRLLFVCAGNVQRSPTFEKFFKKNFPEHEIRSAGIWFGYPYRVDEETLSWAERIYVMDLSQHRFIKNRYPKHLGKVIVIGVSDEYDRESPQLYEIIEYWVENFFKKEQTIRR